MDGPEGKQNDSVNELELAVGFSQSWSSSSSRHNSKNTILVWEFCSYWLDELK